MRGRGGASKALPPLLPAKARQNDGWLDLIILVIAQRDADARGTARPIVNGEDTSGREEEMAEGRECEGGSSANTPRFLPCRDRDGRGRSHWDKRKLSYALSPYLTYARLRFLWPNKYGVV
jgi:hypothetical protein